MVRGVLPAFLLAIVLASCSTLTVDSSPSSLTANDKTMIMSACGGVPTGGLDVCRFVAGSKIEGVWRIILPFNEKITEGSLRIRYRDTVLTVPVTSSVVEIPWKEIVSRETWSTDLEAPVQALGKLQYSQESGLGYVDILGIAFPIVLKAGYTPLSINDTNAYFSQTCRIEYTTSGRSSILCHP